MPELTQQQVTELLNFLNPANEFNADEFEALMERIAENNLNVTFNYFHEKNCTPLILAAALDNTEAVQYLIKNGVDVNSFMPDDADEPPTLLNYFSSQNNTNMVLFLLDNGAEGDISTLSNAVSNHNAEILSLLLDRMSDHISQDNLNHLLFNYVIEDPQLDIVKLFIKAGASPNVPMRDEEDEDSLFTALEYAEHHQLEIVNALNVSGVEVAEKPSSFQNANSDQTNYSVHLVEISQEIINNIINEQGRSEKGTEHEIKIKLLNALVTKLSAQTLTDTDTQKIVGIMRAICSTPSNGVHIFFKPRSSYGLEQMLTERALSSDTQVNLSSIQEDILNEHTELSTL